LLNFYRITYSPPSRCSHKPPYFDGEDYCMWSDKMRHHLTSLHESI
jgi:hypothetical protein